MKIQFMPYSIDFGEINIPLVNSDLDKNVCFLPVFISPKKNQTVPQKLTMMPKYFSKNS